MKLQPHIHSFLYPQPYIHGSYIHGSYIQSPIYIASFVFSTFGPSRGIFSRWLTHTWLRDKLSYCLQVYLTKIEMIWAKNAVKRVVRLYETYKKYEQINSNSKINPNS